MTGPYDDILHLPHPTSKRHPRMPIVDRAAQFSPFAALTGHKAAIEETARVTDRRIELDEDLPFRHDREERWLRTECGMRLNPIVAFYLHGLQVFYKRQIEGRYPLNEGS